MGKLAQRLAECWRVMSPPERNPYESLARRDKQRYESELKSYKQGTFTGSSSICAAHVHTAMREMQQAADRSLEEERSEEAKRSSESEKPMELNSSQELDADNSPQEEGESETSPSDDGSDEEGKGSNSQERNELEQLCELYQ